MEPKVSAPINSMGPILGGGKSPPLESSEPTEEELAEPEVSEEEVSAASDFKTAIQSDLDPEDLAVAIKNLLAKFGGY